MATTNELGDCSKAHLTLHVPQGRSRPMRKLLRPLLRAGDPALSLLHVLETPSPLQASELRPPPEVPKYAVGCEVLTTPALSLMVFLPEDDAAQRARDRLRQFPWKFHHRIELHSAAWGARAGPDPGGGLLSGKQEFYCLSRQYPLCAACASPSSSSCIVRFNLFVRNYRAMLEFYRLLTDSEMESTKPDFALFTINTSHADFPALASAYSLSSSLSSSSSSSSCSSSLSSTGSLSSSRRRRERRRSSSLPTVCSVQLALKHCPYLDPYPLTSAYLTVFVRNMAALLTVLPGKVVQCAPNSFLVRDPDGNCLVVHDVAPAFVPAAPGKLFRTRRRRSQQRASETGSADGNASGQAQALVSGKASSKGSSCCESQDSGRFSDSELGSSERRRASDWRPSERRPSDWRPSEWRPSELDRCLERLVRTVSVSVTDYSESSDTDTSDQEGPSDLDDSGACLGVGSSLASDGSSRTRYQIGPLQSIRHEKRKVVYL